MSTIYKELTTVKTINNNPNIQKKLVDIFKIICDIDLSHEETPFIFDGGSLRKKIVYNYKFKYGVAYVETYEQEMRVIFVFNNSENLVIPFNIPLRSSRCVVQVDHDLNFIDGRFGFFTSFSNKNSEEKESGYILLCFESINNGTMWYNQVSYSNTVLEEKIGLQPSSIDEIYSIPNDEFEQIFIKFMTYCSKNTEYFYNVFSEYPKCKYIVENINELIIFLNLLSQQYVENPTLLKSRILLLTMQVI